MCHKLKFLATCSYELTITISSNRTDTSFSLVTVIGSIHINLYNAFRSGGARGLKKRGGLVDKKLDLEVAHMVKNRHLTKKFYFIRCPVHPQVYTWIRTCPSGGLDHDSFFLSIGFLFALQ
jgi:hypothetical protein